MDADTHFESIPIGDGNAGALEADVNNTYTLEMSGGVINREVQGAWEFVTGVELDLACSSEKLINLNILMMHVATKESEFEAFISDKEKILKDHVEEVLEFNLLSGVLESEVSELENFMSMLQAEILDAREFISSSEHLRGAIKDIEEKLHDSEESLKESLEQVSEIKGQSSNFQRILSCFGVEPTRKDYRDVDLIENGDLDSNITMQTAEQQRDILRMLEKSLARELDLEKSVAESREIEEYLKRMLQSSEHDILRMEDEAVVTWERLFEGENTAEVLMGISKELFGRLHILTFNLNGSCLREGELRSRLRDSIEQLKVKDSTIKDTEDLIEDLKLKVSKAESLAESAEGRCIIFSESNSGLRGRMDILKASLLRAEETKKATAKDISIRTKLITDLVMQLATERERLQKQVSSLTQDNKILVKQLCQISKSPVNVSHNRKGDKHHLSTAISMRGSKDRAKFSSGPINPDTRSRNVPVQEPDMGLADSKSEFGSVRNIDARQLNLKYVFMVVLVLVISVLAASLFQQPDSEFEPYASSFVGT